VALLLVAGNALTPWNQRLEIIFPDWLAERFPLYASHPSRNHLPPKTRAFLDFVIATVKSPNLDSQ
jgi:DNA-binding transcriptional LysR family regulator